jgi:hypothetical protein
MFKYLLIVIAMTGNHKITFKEFKTLNNCEVVKKSIDDMVMYLNRIKTSCVKIDNEDDL